MGTLISFILFIISFITWAVLIISSNKLTWKIIIMAFLWGFFMAQTFIGLCGQETIIDMLIK